MKRIVSFLILALIVFGANAQVPGFMGKKHQFSYTPNIAFSARWHRNKDNFGSLFRVSHNFEYLYTAQKRFAFGVFYNVLVMNNLVHEQFYGISNDLAPVKYARHIVGLTGRKYLRQNDIAPLGTYMKFQLGVIMDMAKYTDDSYKTIEDYRGYNKYITNPKFNGFDIMVGGGIGREFIVANIMPIEIGVDLNLPFGSIARMIAEDDMRELALIAARQNLASTLFRFNISVGILAF